MQFDPQYLMIFIPTVLLSISVHESAHAASAFHFGDDTASLQGRISLNPIRHLDPMGALAFAIVGLGWAKPVPVNPARLRNMWRDSMLVSLAGPVSNFVLAGLLIAATWLMLLGTSVDDMLMRWDSNDIDVTIAKFLLMGVRLNLALGFFNLVPIPPLDGSHVLEWILPEKWAEQYARIGAYGIFLLLGFIYLGGVMVIWLPTYAIMGFSMPAGLAFMNI